MNSTVRKKSAVGKKCTDGKNSAVGKRSTAYIENCLEHGAHNSRDSAYSNKVNTLTV